VLSNPTHDTVSHTRYSFHFKEHGRQGRARAGVFHTPHGDLLTPVFAPVGTQGSVKAISPKQLEELGATLVLANTYHLYLRPGDHIIAEMGGLHKFMGWPHPILTDSGGFQVFSLAANREIDNNGVTFKSHIDGSLHQLTPEKAIEIQENLGGDIIMAFDECAPPHERDYNRQAMARTHNWAGRCLKSKRRSDQALFGIVQGGVHLDLRQESACFISSLEFPGHAIGGLSVGETKEEMYAVLDLMDDILPRQKPRYLMGVGTPEDLINGVSRGIDIFDCVLPTRLARHNAALTCTGRLNLVNATYARDPLSIEENCSCYTCQNFSRAYLRHLIVAKEMLSATLLSIHNLHTLVQLAHEIRSSILQGRFDTFAREYLARQKQSKEDDGESIENQND
jgi:queuine tRNA-ribosyltransferase